jgi:hypothetical protein
MISASFLVAVAVVEEDPTGAIADERGERHQHKARVLVKHVARQGQMQRPRADDNDQNTSKDRPRKTKLLNSIEFQCSA